MFSVDDDVRDETDVEGIKESVKLAGDAGLFKSLGDKRRWAAGFDCLLLR